MSIQSDKVSEKALTPARAGAGVSEAGVLEKEPLGEKLEHARERASDAYQRVKARAVDTEAEFEDYVRQHPVKSVLVAAGVGAGIGVLLGVILGRR